MCYLPREAVDQTAGNQMHRLLRLLFTATEVLHQVTLHPVQAAALRPALLMQNKDVLIIAAGGLPILLDTEVAVDALHTQADAQQGLACGNGVVHHLQVIGPELVSAADHEGIHLLQNPLWHTAVRRQDAHRDTALIIDAVAVVIAEEIHVFPGIGILTHDGRCHNADDALHWNHLFRRVHTNTILYKTSLCQRGRKARAGKHRLFDESPSEFTSLF